MRFETLSSSSKEHEKLKDEASTPEQILSEFKQALQYKLRGEDCDQIVLEFCSRINEPYPATKDERKALLAKCDQPDFLEKIKHLKSTDLRPHEESLNEMVSVTYESPEVVLLHVGSVGRASAQEKLGLFKDGLARLASLLKTDPRLATVETIGALSWIVSEHPRILERLGFSLGSLSDIVDGEIIERKYQAIKEHFPTLIPSKYQKTDLGFASVPKEEFLRRYNV